MKHARCLVYCRVTPGADEKTFIGPEFTLELRYVRGELFAHLTVFRKRDTIRPWQPKRKRSETIAIKLPEGVTRYDMLTLLPEILQEFNRGV